MTIDHTEDSSRSNVAIERRAKAPGFVVVWSGKDAAHHALAVDATPVIVGRTSLARDFGIEDARASREHAALSYDDGQWLVRDCGSKNGTFVDGQPVEGEWRGPHLRVLRVGETLLLACDDVGLHRDRTVRVDERGVVGPRLAQLYAEIAEIAETASTLHIAGSTGSGKELAARHFHLSTKRKGPFVAINCATLVPQIAERLLFGTVRGAYSGAESDAVGHFQQAHGGTLFLDEVGELPLEVQAKFLRALESSEVQPLGGQKAVRVDVRVCSATHARLEIAVERGRFRQDLFYRLARPVVTLPDLRDHLEDVPWLVARALDSEEVTAHSTFVEAALLRRWPGNIRELLLEVSAAVRAAKRDQSPTVKARHLTPQAGLLVAKPETTPLSTSVRTPKNHEASVIRAVLRRQNGNVAGTARALGMHRTQLRRAMARLGIVPDGEQ